MKKAAAGTRQLEYLPVGPAIRSDLNVLGVRTVEQLARRDPRVLYDRLCRQTGRRQDPCVLDTFRMAVAQAQDPDLPVEYAVGSARHGNARDAVSDMAVDPVETSS